MESNLKCPITDCLDNSYCEIINITKHIPENKKPYKSECSYYQDPKLKNKKRVAGVKDKSDE